MKTDLNITVNGKSTGAALIPVSIPDELLSAMGVSRATTPASRKAAVATIKGAGGYVPASIDDGTLSIAGAIVRNAQAAEKAHKRVLLGLAILDRAETWKALTDENGKAYTSVNAFFKAMFPSLAGSSTARNYLATARKLYLPAAEGTLPDVLKPIAEMEPSTASIANSIIDDEDAMREFPQALKDAQGDGKLTANILRKAVKAAREAAHPVADSTTPDTAKGQNTSTVTKAAEDTEIMELRVACKKVFMPDFLEGEYHLTIGEDRVKDYITLISNASKSPEAALIFVKAFAQAVNVKP